MRGRARSTSPAHARARHLRRSPPALVPCSFPIAGIQDKIQGGVSLAASSQVLPYIGKAFSYAWWMMSFQLVVGVVLAGAAAAKPAVRGGAALLLAVLTTSTFLFTYDVCNAYLGAYALSHNSTGTPATVTGTHASHVSNALFVLFSGLIIVDVANALVRTHAAMPSLPPHCRIKMLAA